MSLPNVFRELLRIDSRVGFPGTLVRLGDAQGRLLYLEVATSPIVQIAALEPDDVRQLHAALVEWLRDRDEEPEPRVRVEGRDVFYRHDGEEFRVGTIPDPSPAPLVAGRIGASLREAASTVQFCTVGGPAHGA